ncbi:hypothetical protein ACHAWO_011976 [Cyclotella atomus]|uniref:Uncharacterized protein n=1 Tax=Cyclotella atomus TaxID=382360 RepID=A0ABD3PBN4_9STRA
MKNSPLMLPLQTWFPSGLNARQTTSAPFSNVSGAELPSLLYKSQTFTVPSQLELANVPRIG